MKVTLIQAPAWGTYDPPLSIAQLSACLKSEGHELFVLDMNIKLYLRRTENYKDMWAWEQSQFWYDPECVRKFFEDNSKIIDGYIKDIIDSGVQVVGFSLNASSRLASIEISKRIKQSNDKIIIIFGGPLFFDEKFAVSVLDEPSIDITVKGEGEVMFCELLQYLENKKDISSCKGIVFKNGDRTIVNEPRELMPDLDNLPFLDFSGLPLGDYDDSRHVPFMASRGCILNCAFCSSRSFWKGYRAMSGKRIFEEIQFHINQQRKINSHFSHIDFVDLLFNGSMKSLVEFCECLIKAKLNIAWTANMIIRQDMTFDIIEKMKEAGCEHVLFGIESGSPNVLRLMKKNFKISDADRIVKELHEAKIIVTCNFMFGFPGETEEDFQMTLNFIKRNSAYLDRVYPSRTFCAIEEFSYLAGHLDEFNINPDAPNHLYWTSKDGSSTYPERLRRCEEFCSLASSLGIEVGCGVQTSVELDRWFNLGHYYEYSGDFKKALDCFLRYCEIDKENETISNKIKYCSDKLKSNGSLVDFELKKKVKDPDEISRGESYPTHRVSKKEDIQRRFTWNIHYDCNYSCPYCFFEGKWDEYKNRNIYLSVSEWMIYWNRIYERYGRCYILITGGEPFIYPNFIELIEKLFQKHYPINISTNASGNLTAFLNKIDPERVSLSVSFQPYFDKIDLFLDKVRLIRKNRFKGCINFVAYPPVIKDIEHYIERFSSIGEGLKIIPFCGMYKGKEYPFAYTDEEKRAIGVDNNWFNKTRKKGSVCPSGFDSALVFPDGKVSRCGQIGEKMIIGNFFDRNFSLLDEKLPCDAEFCPCDEDKLFGEEEPAKVIFENQNNNMAIIPANGNGNNSLLNDKEYSEGKIILESSPKSIFIQVAGPCNSNCVFCSREAEYEMFSLDKHRKRFEKNLYPFIAKSETLFLTGSGEFLQLAGAGDILDFFDTNFPDVEKCFSTNGSSLIPRICEKIVNSRSRYTIHISLHASNAALHKRLTHTENFHKILGQINYLLKLRNGKENLKINLIFVATALNVENLSNFVRLAASMGVDRVICYYNYIYNYEQKFLSCFFKQEITNSKLEEAASLANHLKIRITLPPKFEQQVYPSLGPCREAWSQIMFDMQGHVLPCDASEDCNEILSDNRNFMEIWNGRYYQNLRRSLLEQCNSCFNHCFRANPSSINDFESHVIRRGEKERLEKILTIDS
jgi:radical SAM superfamily enzyme YgiQ (UPF0313 family)/molybdenum cofactor biosynthesis enzyme MoaA